MIVAFGHQVRVGKTSAANFLKTWLSLKNRSATITSFATKLKKILHIMYAWAGVQEADYYEKNPLEKLITIPALGMSYRELMIKFGTTLVRDQLYRETWVYATLTETTDFTIITDCRFWNEAQAVSQKDGLLVKVMRPGFDGDGSVADTDLDDYTGWHWEIEAENLRELNQQVITFAEHNRLDER